jgi:hypothetical protein
MIETNIRLVLPGNSLHLEARRLEVSTTSTDPEMMQRITAKLAGELRCACVPFSPGGQSEILAAKREAVPVKTIESDDWTAAVNDTGQELRLTFANPSDRSLLADLLQRALVLRLREVTSWWHYDGFRMWFEPEPFASCEDVAAYRRYLVSAVILEGVGIGFAVDVGTAFFTTRTVADYFVENGGGSLRSRFELLSERQQDQKGTLLYDLGVSKHKCYFDEFCYGLTCSATPPLKIHGRTYPSLFEYIRQRHPSVKVGLGDPVARVSFPRIDRPQPVPAARLRLRVMNESLPKALSEVDKLTPADRKTAIDRFWQVVGLQPFGPAEPSVSNTFLQPEKEKVLLLRPPALIFSKRKRVEAPIERTIPAYREWFRERVRGLNHGGVYYTPATVPRKVFFCSPATLCAEALTAFADELCEYLSDWMGVTIQSVVLPPYQNLDEGMARLQREAQSGAVVFVFEDQHPAAYFEIQYGLKQWRVKRVTTDVLSENYRNAREFLSHPDTAPQQIPRSLRDWRSFVRMCALDVLQKLGCLPWRVEPALGFEAELSIDVGWDRRHFALSLLVNRGADKKPDFHLNTIVELKPDVNHESINPELLREAVLKVFRMLPAGESISSLLVLRDGRVCGREPEALNEAFPQLKREGKLAPNAEIVLADVHKTGTKDIRLWEVAGTNRAQNVLEGIGVLLDSKSVLLCTTGAATLHMRTADPLLLVVRTDEAKVERLAEHFFISAQLNYSSPGVAQRLSAGLKRTDEELEARAAQEIRRVR